MEIGLAILLFVCMTALLYVVLSLKITRQVDLQMKEFYKTRIHADIQEFYRDMEGYAALLETRIKQFKLLVERSEDAVRARAEHAAPAQQPAKEPEAEPLEYAAPEPMVPRAVAVNPKTAAVKKQPKLTKAQLKAAEKAAKAAQKTKASAAAAAAKGKPVKTAPTPARQNISVKAETRAPMPRPPEPQRPVQPFVPVESAYAETDDSAIAEELMKDLFAQDQVKFSSQPAAKKPEAAPAPAAETAGERTMANFFSRIGKTVGPIVFGEKPPAPEAQKKPEPAKQPAQTAAAKPVADFSEVLRRAEQIKAEKKAERERAEVEARAEFYASGDTMSPTTPQERRPSRAASGDTISPTTPPGAARAEAARKTSLSASDDYAEMTASRAGRELRDEYTVSQPATARGPVPQAARQNLAVKDLDQHTINFLIDSLKQENGYRKQALRALTENNIPLPEIARLSKIDIGELELMRQLGRF